MIKFCLKLSIKITYVAFIFAIILPASYAYTNIEGLQTFKRSIPLSAERKQKLADDIDRYYAADNMWDVLRSEFVLPHYENNPEVREQIAWFMNNQDFLLRTAIRAAPYLYYITQQTRKRHLPAELVLLPMIESAYNPFAYSSAGAAGIWQMMPGTAQGFGIKQNWWYDGRRDVVASTKAALDYLTYLGGFFEGNWLLAIAAYDTGEGNVLAAIRRNVRDGYNTDFWSLPVAQETRTYVPRLLALATIIAHPERYPINFPPVPNAPYLAQVDVGGQIDLNQAANLAGLSLKELRQLNPGYNHNTTDPHGPFKITMPIENVAQFMDDLRQSPLYNHIKWLRYRAHPGDTVTLIAKKFNTTPSSIREANAIQSEHIKQGAKLLIPTTAPLKSLANSQTNYPVVRNTAPAATAKQHPKSRSTYVLQPGDTLYMARSGDTLASIAAKFHTTVAMLGSINQIKQNSALANGTQLIIPTHKNQKSTTQHYNLTGGDTIYRVRVGDTLESIAARFNTQPAAIRVINMLANNNVQAGDQIIIPGRV